MFCATCNALKLAIGLIQEKSQAVLRQVLEAFQHGKSLGVPKSLLSQAVPSATATALCIGASLRANHRGELYMPVGWGKFKDLLTPGLKVEYVA